MGDVAGKQPHGRRQVDHPTPGMNLWVQNVQHSDVVAGVDQPARERAPDKSRSASDKHGC
jgi:hypothetical protein